MSININHPQDDISTDGGNPPALGGQSPLVADNATVSADSDGNVSRWVMDTAAITAGYWSKICTVTNTYGDDNVLKLGLEFVSPHGNSGGSSTKTVVDIELRDEQGTNTGLQSAWSYIQTILSGNVVPFNGIMAVGSTTTGQPTEIWIKNNLTLGRVIAVRELYREETSPWTVAYNNNSTWQSATPSGAVTITSDWAGAGTFLPYTEGDSTAGTGTYGTRTASYQIKNGRCVGWLRVDQTAHTGTGNIIIKGLPKPHAGPSGLHATCAIYSSTFVIGTGKQLAALVYQGTSEIRLYAIDLAGGATAQIAMDATAGFMIYFDYPV